MSRINELNPIGTASAFAFSVFENSPVDTLVGKVTDAVWPFNNMKYTIVRGNLGTPPKFYIEPDTGIVKALISINHKSKDLIYTHWKCILFRNYDHENILKTFS